MPDSQKQACHTHDGRGELNRPEGQGDVSDWLRVLEPAAGMGAKVIFLEPATVIGQGLPLTKTTSTTTSADEIPTKILVNVGPGDL